MRKVTATDGIRLAVYENGPPDAPVLICVHGYPDNHTVWDGIVAELSGRFRVVTYDVRGFGASDAPAKRAAYRIKQLNKDLGTVIDAVSPDRPVHVLAHDWGSVQSWSALPEDKLGRRIASYTSVSGPSLDYAGLWLRDVRRNARPILKQIAESLYIGVFLAPILSGWLARKGIIDRVATRSGGHLAARSRAETASGLNLYRANIVRRLRSPRPPVVDLPVQVLAPIDDRYISVVLQANAPLPYVRNLHFVDIAGHHWAIAQYPAIVASLVTEFVKKVGVTA